MNKVKLNVNTKNLTILKDYLKDNVLNRNYGLDMRTYVRGLGANECNTTACVMGWSVHAFDLVDEYKTYMSKTDDNSDYFEDLCEKLFNLNARNLVLAGAWEFLFDSDWNNSVEEAIIRLEFVIENDCVPSSWDGDNFEVTYKTDWSPQ